jgi:hypothetical protein
VGHLILHDAMLLAPAPADLRSVERLILHDLPWANPILAPTDFTSVERVFEKPDRLTSTQPPAPTDLRSVERLILHYTTARPRAPAPTDFTSVERVFEHQTRRERHATQPHPNPRPHAAVQPSIAAIVAATDPRRITVRSITYWSAPQP